MDDEEVNEDRDVSILSLLLIPATVVAVINIVFYNQIKNQLRPDPDQRNGEKRTRFGIFFGINIFSYLIIAQLFLGTLYIPISVCLALAVGAGYYLANSLFPEEQNRDVPELPIEEEVTSEEAEETTVERKRVGLEEFKHGKVDQMKDEKVQLLEQGQRFKKFLDILGLGESSKLTLSDQRVINEKLLVTEGSDAIQKFLYQVSLGQQTALQDLAESVRNLKDQKRVTDRDEGMRDILFAILSHCDVHLLQELLCNLAMTGNAVPIILPLQKQNPILLHWGLRRSLVTTTKWGVSSVVSQPFVTISAIRFGKVGISKSNVLNDMLSKVNDSKGYHKVFISEDNENAFSKGLVECTWCLPMQREDDMERPLVVLNLRGDSVTYSRQAAFCCKVSSIIIVFVEPPIHIDIEKQIKHFAETTEIVLVSTKTGLQTQFQTDSNVTVVDTDDSLKNVGQIIHEHLAKPSHGQISFATFCKVCQELDIEVDEEFLNCQTAKNTSRRIFDSALVHERSTRDDQFPLHKLWKDWVSIDMEEIGAENIEHSISSKLQRKKEVRNQQKNAELGESFGMLLGAFKGDIEYLHLVYRWLEILLENATRMKYDKQTDLDQFDVNYFMEEVGQIVECDHVVLRNEEYSTGEEHLYPEKFAHLFEKGISLLLCDSNINAIPIQWLGEVFDSLQSRTQADAKVCVVAAIGCHQTPIVSLLNQLFGVNFSLTTRSHGLLTQLVPIESPAKETIGCDFLLLINTEVINLNGEMSEQVQERNNFICSLTTCLADVVLINTNENMTQQDTIIFLSTIVDSIEKMNDVNKSGKCYLVRTFTDNQNASETKHLSTLMFEETESNFKDILKRKGREKHLEDIVEVFSCDNENLTTIVRGHEKSFASNYHLDPTDIIALRGSILQLLHKLNRPPISFSGFCQRLADVGKALKSKSFVENFQDTNVEKLNEEFVALYRGMLLKVRQELSENLTVACNDLRYVSAADIESTKSSKVNEMTEIVENKMNALHKNVSEMLHSTKYKCFLDQEHYFEQDIATNKESFMEEVENAFQKVLKEASQSQPISSKVKDERQRFIQILERNKLDNDSTAMIETTIEQTKQEFLTTVHHRYPLHKLCDIQEFTERNMKHFLSQCGKEVESLLGNKSLSDCASPHVVLSNPDDLKSIGENFNVANTEKQVLFDKIHSTVKSMSCKPETIDSNSKVLCKLLKEVEEEFSVIVEPITMYLFFCSKFIDEVHKFQDQKEVNAVSVDDVDYGEGNPSNYDLESKAVLILTNLEIVCSKSDMMILREVITSSNITKCSMLPFTLIALQRLDRYFINMLPILSPDDMKSINNTMNETKMIMISRTLSKECLDFGETFNDVYRLIQRAIIDGEEGDRAKAAAIVHIAAWSSDLISVKLLEDKKLQNVANNFEKDELKLCLAMIMTKHHINCDAIIAEIVGEEIEMSLLRATEELIMRRLRDQFSVTSDVFNLKRLFIGTVLRDLCIKDEYLNFAYFFKDYDSFAQKWILEFIAKECNKDNASLLKSLKKEIVHFYMTNIEKVLEETVNEFQVHSQKSLQTWLELFQKNMRTTCKTNCRMRVMKDLSTTTTVTDFDYFADTLRQAFKVLRPQLESSIVLPHVGNKDDTKTWLMTLPGEIHIDLAQIIKGCIEQCPFCGAACEKTIEGHESHETELHYPGGLKSWHDVISMKLFTEVCTSAVASNMRYRAPDFEFRPYSEYKTDYPNWNITPQVDEPNEYWKYIFNRFNTQFAKHYSCVQADIPEGWSKFTKEEAIRSVENGYDLSPL